MDRDLNLRHFAALIEVCDNDLSVSKAASKLNVDQSVVSRNLRALETYFGAPLFKRKGRRLAEKSLLCISILESLRDIDVRVSNLRTLATETLSQPPAGMITIGCTHLQARYLLPHVVLKVRSNHPDIKVRIHQGFPDAINKMLMENQVDLGICSEMLAGSSALISKKAFTWERILIAPVAHKILKIEKYTLKQLAKEPVITYITGITGRRVFDNTFLQAGLKPNVVIAAADSDVIKEFTRKNYGVGIISHIAYEENKDKDLVARKLPGLFKPMDTYVAYRADRVLTSAQNLFIKQFQSTSTSHAKRCQEYLA